MKDFDKMFLRDSTTTPPPPVGWGHEGPYWLESIQDFSKHATMQQKV